MERSFILAHFAHLIGEKLIMIAANLCFMTLENISLGEIDTSGFRVDNTATTQIIQKNTESIGVTAVKVAYGLPIAKQL